MDFQQFHGNFEPRKLELYDIQQMNKSLLWWSQISSDGLSKTSLLAKILFAENSISNPIYVSSCIIYANTVKIDRQNIAGQRNDGHMHLCAKCVREIFSYAH